MSVFATYLCREWREHRSALALCIAFSSGLSVWFATYLDEYTVRVETVPLFAVLQGIVLYVLVVGGSLLGPDERNAPRFFERAPRGLAGAFLAKTAFFHIGVLVSAATSLVALCLGTLALIGFAPSVEQSFSLTWSFLFLTVPVLAWTLAASAWVPRAALALPMGLSSLALLAWPYLAMAVLFGDHFVIVPDQAVVFVCAMTLAGYSAAWVGYRFARGAAPRALYAYLATLVLGIVFAAPSWIWIVQSRQAPSTIEWDQNVNWSFPFIDGTTGQLFQWGRGALPWQADSEERAFVLDEESGVFRVLSEADSANWHTEPLPGGGCHSEFGSRGYVYTLVNDGARETRYCDRAMERDFSAADILGSSAHPLYAVWIGRGSWIVQPTEDAPFFAFDPETRERRALPWPHPEEILGGFGLVLPDGRFLWSFDERLFVGDPETGSFKLIETPDDPGYWGFLTLYLMEMPREDDSRPTLLSIEGNHYILQGDQIIPGPCLSKDEHADIFGYREFSDHREYLWIGAFGTIWSSDVDTGAARRLFPAEGTLIP